MRRRTTQFRSFRQLGVEIGHGVLATLHSYTTDRPRKSKTSDTQSEVQRKAAFNSLTIDLGSFGGGNISETHARVMLPIPGVQVSANYEVCRLG